MNEWKKVKLKEVIKEVNERNKGEKIKRVLSVTNSRGFVSQEEYFEGTVHSANISNYKIVRKNQFAYNPSRVNVGSIDILKDYEEGALSPMYIVFEVDTTKLLPDYFKYYFQTNRFFENVKNNTQGSVRNSLSFKALSDFDYLLPPIEEQEKIVEILKTIDSIIEKHESLLEEKNQFIKSQFVEMFENKEYPKKRMDEVAILKSGTTFNKEYELQNGDLLYCKVSDMNLQGNEKYMISSKTYVTKDVGLKSSIPANSVIFPKRGGAIGTNKKRIIIKDTCVDLNTMGVTPKESINIQYLYYYFINIDLATLCDGSAVPQLNNKNIGPLEISVAPIEIQQHFANIVEQIDKQKFLLEKQKQNYENLRKGLMQKLLTGKVRVKI